MTVYCTHNGTRRNITGKVGNISWSDSTDSLGSSFSLDVPYSYWDENYNEMLGVGDIITIFDNGSEVFRGIITSAPIGGSTYTGYDYGWYMNKTEVVIQFNSISAQKAILRLLDRCETPVGNVAKMSTSIKKVYKNECVSDIVSDILDKVKSETGKTYRMEIRKGKLYIEQSKTEKLYPTYTDELGEEISCSKTAEISGTRSIDEMKNKVIVTGTSTDKTEIKATAKNASSISKYGLITMVEMEDNLTSAKAKNKAKTLLNEYNKVTKNFTATMRGDFSVRSGRKLYFNRPEVGITGWFNVKNCTHNVTGGVHMMTVTMEN